MVLVLSRCCFVHRQTAGLLVAKSHPSDYTQGIMELGAVVCTPTSPSCASCPVRVVAVPVDEA